MVGSGRRPDPERERQICAADRLGVLSRQQAGRIESRRRGRGDDVLSHQHRRRNGVRQRGRRRRQPGREHRQLRHGCDSGLHENQERDSGRRRRDRSAGLALSSRRRTSATSTATCGGSISRWSAAFRSITAKTNLQSVGRAHPLFASMATVNVGATQQYIFFGTGSDLLPSAGLPSNHSYKLMSVLDNGATGPVKYTNTLQSINLTAPDEKVTGFPAVAGDIVFFVTTLTKPNLPCNLPDATLYATTFTGGLGYTAQAGAQGTGAILTVTGARATAPFIVDQHVAFGFGIEGRDARRFERLQQRRRTGRRPNPVLARRAVTTWRQSSVRFAARKRREGGSAAPAAARFSKTAAPAAAQRQRTPKPAGGVSPLSRTVGARGQRALGHSAARRHCEATRARSLRLRRAGSQAGRGRGARPRRQRSRIPDFSIRRPAAPLPTRPAITRRRSSTTRRPSA